MFFTEHWTRAFMMIGIGTCRYNGEDARFRVNTELEMYDIYIHMAIDVSVIYAIVLL